MQEFIEVVVNKKTGQLFIMLDESASRYKLINPAGEQAVLPVSVFEEDPVLLEGDEIAAKLSEQQLAAWQQHQNKLQADVQQEARKRQEIKEREQQILRSRPERVETKPKRSTGSRIPRKKADNRVGLGNEWTSPKLTFYRHKIDPLGPKQRFRIIVGPDKLKFEIKKEEFLSVFNDVVMSDEYRTHNYYTFREFPERAKRYLRDS